VKRALATAVLLALWPAVRVWAWMDDRAMVRVTYDPDALDRDA
jgi:hypothetical protein